MEEPEKPFACNLPDCGMSFTNEDHLHVHTKKHDMVLQFGLEQKTAFVADQTPTPTRFIRNCEEVGLFQDLQNVNPFDEGFKRAMETKHSLCLEGSGLLDDTLHTPHFPLLDPGDTLYSTTNNKKNITISRSSSDETGAVKHETTTISKLTNEVTTISRVVGKQMDVPDKVTIEDKQTEKRDIVNETSISYTNNVIIQSNLEIRKDNLAETNKPVTLIYKGRIESNNKDINENNSKPKPIQNSIVVGNGTEQNNEKKKVRNDKIKRTKTHVDPKDIKTEMRDDYEVTIKLPNGKQVKMKPVEENEIKNDTKAKLKKVLVDKEKQSLNSIIQTLPIQNAQIVQNLLPIAQGRLIPVTFVSPAVNTILSGSKVGKLPIVSLNSMKMNNTPKPAKRKNDNKAVTSENDAKCDGNGDMDAKKKSNLSKRDLESRCAASKRYRARLKDTARRQTEEIKKLTESNQRLIAEKAILQMIITEHLKKCPNAEDLRNIKDKIQT